MKPLTFRSLLALALLHSLTPGRAHGDPIELSYSWNYGKTYHTAFGTGDLSLSSKVSADGTAFTTNHGSGSATFTLSSGGPTTVSAGTPILLPIGTLSSAILSGEGSTFGYTADFGLNLHLSDNVGNSGILTLGGSIIGDVTPTGATIFLSGGSTYESPLVLGEHSYHASFAPTTLSMIDVGGEPVLFLAELFVDGTMPWYEDKIPLDGNAQSAENPEPSSLVLGACALALCGAGALRRRLRRS